MDFIDRQKEQEILSQALCDHKAKFIVLYGRRRLGKSTLIKRLLTEKDVYYEAEKSDPTMQISLLAEAINANYPGFSTPIYPTWESLLSAYNQICQPNSTLVLDEFPYLVQKTPSLPSTLQRLIDSQSLRYNLVICGSSQRMMQRLILDRSEPLYGRADVKLNLRPIRPQHWQMPFQLNAIQLIEEYSVWGGVPRYWALRSAYSSLKEAIEQLILQEHGLLFDEPSALFLDDSADIASYASIMIAAGRGNNKYSKIADAVGKKTTELSIPLSNLTEMAYLRKEVPFGEHEDKSKKTLYIIDDPFMAFYYRFVVSYKSLLAIGRTEPVVSRIEKLFPEHVSHLWESLCQLTISGNYLFNQTWSMARRWWGKVPLFEAGKKTPIAYEELEFDVVAESLDHPDTLLIGECKWKSPDYADRLLEQLKAKALKAPFTQGKQLIFVLFLKEAPLSEADCPILLPQDVLDNLPQ